MAHCESCDTNKTITLTIDGRDVQVPSGTTILEAARTLGISIPTLCWL
jgi:NADH dehydrogenase/NADH:ubiquinone oxidoreductase subunit G